jgi:hypothetical protein
MVNSCQHIPIILVMLRTHLWSHMTSMSTGERELLEEALQSFLVLWGVWVRLAPYTFQIEVRDKTRSTVARSRDDKSIKVVLLDHAVEVDVSELVRSDPKIMQVLSYVKDWPASLPQ